MGQVNFTSVDNAFHTYFLNKVERIGYEDQPTFEMVAKEDGFTGRPTGLQFDVAFEAPAGMSADFNTALANAGNGRYATFTVRRARYYSIVNLDNETIEVSSDDNGAYVDLKKEEVEQALKVTTSKIGNGVFRNHGGSIGRANGLSTATVTLLNPGDVVNWRVGMFVQAATTDGTSGALRSGRTSVVAVNRGTLATTVTLASTFATDIPGITLTAAGDFLFPEGDFGAMIYGFDSYIPLTAPTAGDAVFGYDRSVDSRLSGMRFDASSYNISDGVMKALGAMRREAGNNSIDTLILNFDRFVDFSLDLGAKALRDPSGKGEVGYDKILISAGGKQVSAMADYNCQDNVAWALTKRVWTWKSLGKTPRFFTTPNAATQTFIVDPTADGVQVRCGWRGNLLCRAPGLNGRITLPTS